MSWYLLRNRRLDGPYAKVQILKACVAGKFGLRDYVLSQEDMESGQLKYHKIVDLWEAELLQLGIETREEKVPEISLQPSGTRVSVDPVVEVISSSQPEDLRRLKDLQGNLQPVDLVPSREKTVREKIPHKTNRTETKASATIYESPGEGLGVWLSRLSFGKSAGALAACFVAALIFGVFEGPSSARDPAAEQASVDSGTQKRLVKTKSAQLQSAPVARERPQRIMPSERPSTQLIPPPSMTPPSSENLANVPPPPAMNAVPENQDSSRDVASEDHSQPAPEMSNPPEEDFVEPEVTQEQLEPAYETPPEGMVE